MIFEKIREIIAEQLDRKDDEITLETSFREDLEADSLDLFQIINDIEDFFDIKIDDVDGIETVGDAVRYVQEQKG